MSANKEIQKFVDGWQKDDINAKAAFTQYEAFLSDLPDVTIDFNARPGVSYSMRARHKNQKDRQVFALVDAVDDDPENRWLSICFYADMVKDPQSLGDEVPAGLFGEDAICFNLDENDQDMREYIGKRLEEAAKKAAE